MALFPLRFCHRDGVLTVTVLLVLLVGVAQTASVESRQTASLRQYLTNLLLDDDTPDPDALADTKVRHITDLFRGLADFQRKDPRTPEGVEKRTGGASAPCTPGGGRQCNDGLMGVWLRIMKNPDYAD